VDIDEINALTGKRHPNLTKFVIIWTTMGLFCVYEVPEDKFKNIVKA